MSIDKLRGIQVQGPFTQTASATTVETTLATTIIPAQSFSLPTSYLRVIAFGTVANNANAKTLKFYVGSASQSLSLQAGVATSWRLEAWVIGNGSASQKTNVAVLCGTTASTGTVDNYTVSTTESDIADITVKITGTATTTNDIVCTGCLFLT